MKGTTRCIQFSITLATVIKPSTLPRSPRQILSLPCVDRPGVAEKLYSLMIETRSAGSMTKEGSRGNKLHCMQRDEVTP